MIPPAWQLKKGVILDEENKALCDSILNNENYRRIANGTILLENWRQFMRNIVNDGAGQAFLGQAQSLREWGDTINGGKDFVDMSLALHRILKELPAIRNTPNRIATAKKMSTEYEAKKKKGEWELGDSLSKALAKLVAGELPQAREASDQTP